MAFQDRDTHGAAASTGSSAGWFIAGALVVALIAGGLFYFNGYFTEDDDLSIELSLPKLDAN